MLVKHNIYSIFMSKILYIGKPIENKYIKSFQKTAISAD